MTKTRVIAALILIAVLAGVRYQMLLNRPAGSEEEQIASLIQRGVSGIERSDVRTAMSVVSKDYKDNYGTTYGSLKIRAADAMNSSVRPDVTITQPVIQVNGDQAEMRAHVRMMDRHGDQLIFEHDLTFRLRKEQLHRYLIFPTREWRIVTVDGLESVLESM
jgi:hypothetical protein